MRGIEFTVLSAIVIASTFIPRGSLALNPPLLEDDLKMPSDVESQDDFDKEGNSLERKATLEDVPVPAPTKIQA